MISPNCLLYLGQVRITSAFGAHSTTVNGIVSCSKIHFPQSYVLRCSAALRTGSTIASQGSLSHDLAIVLMIQHGA